MTNIINEFKNVLVENCLLGHIDKSIIESVSKGWLDAFISEDDRDLMSQVVTVWVMGDPEMEVSLLYFMEAIEEDCGLFGQVHLPTDKELHEEFRRKNFVIENLEKVDIKTPEGWGYDGISTSFFPGYTGEGLYRQECLCHGFIRYFAVEEDGEGGLYYYSER